MECFFFALPSKELRLGILPDEVLRSVFGLPIYVHRDPNGIRRSEIVKFELARQRYSHLERRASHGFDVVLLRPLSTSVIQIGIIVELQTLSI